LIHQARPLRSRKTSSTYAMSAFTTL
jgi:hypothetical protein